MNEVLVALRMRVWEDTPGLREKLKTLYFRQERMVEPGRGESAVIHQCPSVQDSKQTCSLGSIKAQRSQMTLAHRDVQGLCMNSRKPPLEVPGAEGGAGG